MNQSSVEVKEFSDDFVIFKKYQDNFPKLVYTCFTKYKPFIFKMAHRYSTSFYNKIDYEDFASEVYMKLHKNLSTLKEEKMTPSRFSFHPYVRFAVGHVQWKNRKIANHEMNIPDSMFGNNDSENSNGPYSKIVAKTDSYLYEDQGFKKAEIRITYPHFIKKLTKRQIFILKKSAEGYTYNEIKKDLKCSYGTIAGDIWRAKQLAADYF